MCGAIPPNEVSIGAEVLSLKIMRELLDNPSLRQLLHVRFKVAAKMGRHYLDLLEANEAIVAKNVTENLYARHIASIFLGI
jgi:hypothetical protein